MALPGWMTVCTLLLGVSLAAAQPQAWTLTAAPVALPPQSTAAVPQQLSSDPLPASSGVATQPTSAPATVSQPLVPDQQQQQLLPLAPQQLLGQQFIPQQLIPESLMPQLPTPQQPSAVAKGLVVPAAAPTAAPVAGASAPSLNAAAPTQQEVVQQPQQPLVQTTPATGDAALVIPAPVASAAEPVKTAAPAATTEQLVPSQPAAAGEQQAPSQPAATTEQLAPSQSAATSEQQAPSQPAAAGEQQQQQQQPAAGDNTTPEQVPSEPAASEQATPKPAEAAAEDKPAANPAAPTEQEPAAAELKLEQPATQQQQQPAAPAAPQQETPAPAATEQKPPADAATEQQAPQVPTPAPAAEPTPATPEQPAKQDPAPAAPVPVPAPAAEPTPAPAKTPAAPAPKPAPSASGVCRPDMLTNGVFKRDEPKSLTNAYLALLMARYTYPTAFGISSNTNLTRQTYQELYRRKWSGLGAKRASIQFVDVENPLPSILVSQPEAHAVVFATNSDIFVSFRGITNADEALGENSKYLAVNGTFANQKVPVHGGFYRSFAAIWPGVATAMAKAIDQTDDPAAAKIFLTGHSMGAAHALMAALRLVDIDKTVGGVYMFGAPKVGQQPFIDVFEASGLEGRTVHWWNELDLVPNMSPPLRPTTPRYMPLPETTTYRIWQGKCARATRATAMACPAGERRCRTNLNDHFAFTYLLKMQNCLMQKPEVTNNKCLVETLMATV